MKHRTLIGFCKFTANAQGVAELEDFEVECGRDLSHPEVNGFQWYWDTTGVDGPGYEDFKNARIKFDSAGAVQFCSMAEIMWVEHAKA